MSGISYTMPRFQAIDQNGRPMVGATLYTYQNKTTTPHPTWRDKDQTAYNTNPIVLDARGEAVVWLDPEQVYTFVLRDWFGALVWSQDDVAGSASQIDLAAPDGSSMVGFIQAGAGAVARTSRDKMREVVSVKDFGAVGDGVTDDTAAVQKAAEYAAAHKRPLNFEGLVFNIHDTLNIDFDSVQGVFWEGHGAELRFINEEENKPLLNLTNNSTRSTFEDFVFTDVNARTSKAIRISSYPNVNVGPNWKNKFVNVRVVEFKTGVEFTTDGDPLDILKQDWASETLFLHSKFRNCELGALFNNLQSVNNYFLATDIENDLEGEQFTMIQYNTGSGLYLDGCSLIGRGHIFKWTYPAGGINLYSNGYIYINKCRVEARSTHIGSLFYQEPSTIYGSKFLNLDISVRDTAIHGFGQTIDLLHYSGKVRALFDRVSGINANLVIRHFPANGVSSIGSTGTLTDVRAVDCTSVRVVLETTSGGYGIYDSRFLGKINIESNLANANAAHGVDALGFFSLTNSEISVNPYGLFNLTAHRLCWNDPSPTAGFKDVKLKLPKEATPSKFGVFKHPVRIANPIRYKLYIVKDAAAWATPGVFDVNTDAYLVADIGDTSNKAGLFEVPIQLTANVLGNSMKSGYGTNWTEGRMFIEHSGSTAPLGGFVYIEYF